MRMYVEFQIRDGSVYPLTCPDGACRRGGALSADEVFNILYLWNFKVEMFNNWDVFLSGAFFGWHRHISAIFQITPWARYIFLFILIAHCLVPHSPHLPLSSNRGVSRSLPMFLPGTRLRRRVRSSSARRTTNDQPKRSQHKSHASSQISFSSPSSAHSADCCPLPTSA